MMKYLLIEVNRCALAEYSQRYAQISLRFCLKYYRYFKKKRKKFNNLQMHSIVIRDLISLHFWC